MDGAEFIEIADRLDRARAAFTSEHEPLLKGIGQAAAPFARAWSGSNIGYHASIYYEDFARPPAGAHFSQQWGFEQTYAGETRGVWREYRHEDVVHAIYRHAGDPDLAATRASAAALRSMVESTRSDLLSGLTLATQSAPKDAYLINLLERVEKARIHQTDEFARAQLPSGQFMTADTRALSQGIRVAPHQAVLAEVSGLDAPATTAKVVAGLARQAGSHLTRAARRSRKDQLVGTNVFIGHGRAPAWRVLKDFVKDRLGLPYDEFNRVPVAGITNIARLSEMLEAAAVALIILTAEDEQADGKLQARMNVIHEVGLFQGRLGFTKAIVVLEEGCEEFSNIQGLGQIRFPRGNIAAAFEEIRLVLEREGLLKS
ncbi:hypothetical protein E4V01_24300 [Methylorubrum sp. Q1]|uniref:TIR domain-containing protein n=1 Tax=Methylorubrum sp. Q1 TaxID=2562453 RepID=UPI0010769B67|nr:TIR domain-containing protein [Methylorubrum sp. Q1]TFZ54924.1 hypothetical protein E4V01_24300 [Methylorubrum sp. Q1]